MNTFFSKITQKFKNTQMSHDNLKIEEDIEQPIERVETGILSETEEIIEEQEKTLKQLKDEINQETLEEMRIEPVLQQEEIIVSLEKEPYFSTPTLLNIKKYSFLLT